MTRATQPFSPRAALLDGKPLELMPASLLPYRKTWQPLVRSLPQNAYLIVTSLDQKPGCALLLRVVRALRQQGQTVYLLSVGP